MKRLLLSLIVSLCLLSCTNADWQNYKTLGNDAKVRLYSGGVLIGEWESSGKVISEDHSDGYRFVDKKTGKFMRVTGQVIIEN